MPKKVAAGKAATSARGKKTAAGSKAQQTLATLSNLLGRTRMMSKMAGVQYGGERDTYQAAGYVPQGQVSFAHYWGMYTRGDIAGRIVDMPAKTTWRTPPELIIEGQEDGTKFTEAFDALAKRLKVWRYMSRVDRLAGIGQYAVMMIGVKGVDDTQLKTPLKRVNKAEDIIYLSVYHQDNAKIVDWVTDPGDPRFGLPETYSLRTTTNPNFKGANTGAELIVHASRVIHVAEDLLEDEVYGRPRLERSLNRLFDLEKVASSTGEAYWQLAARILQAKIDPNMEIEDADMKVLDERLGELVHDLRRQFSGQGVGLEWLGSETPNVQQVADFYFSLIAGSSGIPKRILFGSEMGELASTTDQDTYLGTINERQEAFAEPDILRAFVDKMVEIGALPKPEGPGGAYQVAWPPLQEESYKDKAEYNAKLAQTAAALTAVGGNPRELVRINEEGDIELVEREPDEPMDLVPPPPNPSDTATQIEDVKQQIADLKANGGDPAEISALEDELQALEAEAASGSDPAAGPPSAEPAATAPETK